MMMMMMRMMMMMMIPDGESDDGGERSRSEGRLGFAEATDEEGLR